MTPAELAPDLMTWTLYGAFGVVALAQVMAMIRLVIGPGTGDRILALDTMVVNAIGLIVLLGIALGTQLYFEVTLLVAMLGFVSTVAYARFVLRGDIIE
jgi:multicomponent K+:H+ antiporter subunit F